MCLTDLQEYFSLSLLYDQTGLSMSQSSQRENVSELSKLPGKIVVSHLQVLIG